MGNKRTATRPGFGAWSQSRLLNVWIDDLSVPEIIDRLDEGILFTVNPNHFCHLQRNADFGAAYASATMVSGDSKYVCLAVRKLGRGPMRKSCGSDIVPAYYRHHKDNPDVRIFLLGARPGVAAIAQERINKETGRDIVVGAHGPSMSFVTDAAECAQVIEMINASGATCLIVGLGAPKQEIWIHRHRHEMPNIKVYMGVGATIDYEAQAVKRAPAWVRRFALEWLYRVVTEPRRYLMRYVRDMEVFWLVLKDRFGLYRPPAFISPVTAPTKAAPVPSSEAMSSDAA
jgi:exopolysaccharide biosynthesis WecB/TagA/CpsF family protein